MSDESLDDILSHVFGDDDVMRVTPPEGETIERKRKGRERADHFSIWGTFSSWVMCPSNSIGLYLAERARH